MRRFDVWVVALDPTQGSEIAKTRPCVIVSPDELNPLLRTVLIAPLTSTRKRYPSRVDVAFRGQPGQVALDQLRTVDKTRLLKCVGALAAPEADAVVAGLLALFAP